MNPSLRIYLGAVLGLMLGCFFGFAFGEFSNLRPEKSLPAGGVIGGLLGVLVGILSASKKKREAEVAKLKERIAELERKKQ
jgi:hypothetical protein